MTRKELKWGNTQYVGTAKRLAGWDNSGVAAEIQYASAAEVNAGTEDAKPVNPLQLKALVEGVVNLGSVSGAVSIDLSTARTFLMTQTANITSFTFTNEVIGRQYAFVITRSTTNFTFTWAAGKFRFTLGQSIILTNPATNGVGTSVDILTGLCLMTGRLDMAITPDMQNN